jgi:hypothetical protein
MSESMSLGRAIGFDAALAHARVIVAAWLLPETKGRRLDVSMAEPGRQPLIPPAGCGGQRMMPRALVSAPVLAAMLLFVAIGRGADRATTPPGPTLLAREVCRCARATRPLGHGFRGAPRGA